MAKFESWYDKVARVMVRQGVSMPIAICELQLEDLTSAEAKRIEVSDKFQKALWAARHAFYAEVANDPARTKNAAIGQMVCIVNRLMEQDKLKDASEAILKLAKLQGWVGESTTVNVFGSLSDKELLEIERKAKEAERSNRQSSADPSDTLQ